MKIKPYTDADLHMNSILKEQLYDHYLIDKNGNKATQFSKLITLFALAHNTKLLNRYENNLYCLQELTLRLSGCSIFTTTFTVKVARSDYKNFKLKSENHDGNKRN